MLETLKKKSFKNSLISSVLLLVFGIILIFFALDESIYALTGNAQFETLAPEEIKNQMVDIDVNTVFDCYLEEYSENTDTHRRWTTHLYYITWTGDENATDFRYITIKVPAKYEEQMEEIMEDTYNNVYSDPLPLTGHIRKLSSEDYDYFEEYFVDVCGFTQAEFEEATLPYYIEVTGAGVKYTYVFITCCGIVLVIMGLFCIIKGARGGYLKKFNAAYQAAGFTESSIESDLNSATSFDKKGKTKLGRLCTYFNLGAKIPYCIPNKDIVWAYQNTTTHRTNGIKTGVTYSVVIYSVNNKKPLNIAVASEATAQEILQKINTMLPWVVLGYSNELKKMYDKNLEQFLQLRYNTVEHTAVEPGFENFNNNYSTPEN